MINRIIVGSAIAGFVVFGDVSLVYAGGKGSRTASRQVVRPANANSGRKLVSHSAMFDRPNSMVIFRHDGGGGGHWERGDGVRARPGSNTMFITPHVVGGAGSSNPGGQPRATGRARLNELTGAGYQVKSETTQKTSGHPTNYQFVLRNPTTGHEESVSWSE